jgi:uncharacterized membrane protein YkvA (DUF1232 family)
LKQIVHKPFPNHLGRFSARRNESLVVMKSVIERWKQKARDLKKETFAIYLAYKDPRVPWYAKLLAACVVGYALSPIDLIPDPIPILGYLDDLVIVPLGIALVVRMIPPEVLQECRQKADTAFRQGKPKNWTAGAIIIVIWVIVFVNHFLFEKMVH